MKQFIAHPKEALDKECIDGYYDKLKIDKEDFFGNALKMEKLNFRYSDLKLRETIDPEDWRNLLVAGAGAAYLVNLNAMALIAGILQGT